MEQVPVTNNSGVTLSVGGKSIKPGETRMVDVTLLGFATAEEYFRALGGGDAAEAAADAGASDDGRDELVKLLDGKVDEITEKLAELSDEQLVVLEQAEQDGKTRKGVLEAIAELQLERAKQA